MQFLACVSSKLHGFGTGKQHAKTQRIEILFFCQLATLINDLAMHERYLRGWSPKDKRPMRAQTFNASKKDGGVAESATFFNSHVFPDKKSLFVGLS